VEFEYATTVEDPFKAAPSMKTGMGNVYVQTPIALAGMKFYATTGAGGYREKLGTVHQETNIAFNTGGGVKISIVGPLKARVDYRAFKLRGTPLYSTQHRFYAGLNLAF
jgi:opacity protein-like surface antigen